MLYISIKTNTLNSPQNAWTHLFPSQPKFNICLLLEKLIHNGNSKIIPYILLW